MSGRDFALLFLGEVVRGVALLLVGYLLREAYEMARRGPWGWG